MKRAERAAITISPASAMPTPAPAAGPLTATTIGFGEPCIFSISGLMVARILSPICSPASKTLARPGQQDRPHRRLRQRRVERLVEIAQQAAAERVVLRGIVQRQDS